MTAAKRPCLDILIGFWSYWTVHRPVETVTGHDGIPSNLAVASTFAWFILMFGTTAVTVTIMAWIWQVLVLSTVAFGKYVYPLPWTYRSHWLTVTMTLKQDTMIEETTRRKICGCSTTWVGTKSSRPLLTDYPLVIFTTGNDRFNPALAVRQLGFTNARSPDPHSVTSQARRWWNFIENTVNMGSMKKHFHVAGQVYVAGRK